MKLLIESHVQRKLQLLSVLYFRKRPISLAELSSILKVSENTVKRDLIKYHLINVDGVIRINIDKNQRIQLYYDMMNESVISQVLRILIKRPGRRAQYYSNELSISKSYFYRGIVALNKELACYGASIVVDDGYHIVAEDEQKFRWFIFFYFIATNSEPSTVRSEQFKVFQELMRLNDLYLPYLEQLEFRGETHHSSMLAVCIIRQSNPKTAIPCDVDPDIIDGYMLPEIMFNTIRSLLPSANRRSVKEALAFLLDLNHAKYLPVSVKTVQQIIDEYTSMFGLTFDEPLYSQIVETCNNVISECNFIAKHFPYNLNSVAVHMQDFYQEYELVDVGLLSHYSAFVHIASRHLNVNFDQLMILLFYFLILSIGDVLFMPRLKILFASSGHQKQFAFSKVELEMMLRVLKIEPNITIVHLSELRREMNSRKYDLILSDTYVDGCDNVYMVKHNSSMLIIDFVVGIFSDNYRFSFDDV